MKCEICKQDNPPEARFCGNCGAALATTVERPSPVSPEPRIAPIVAVEYMGFWIRLVATIVDVVIIWLFFWMLSLVLLSSAILVGPLLYYWLFTGLKGQTLGKMLVGIKVVDAQGNRPGLFLAALREVLGKIISTIVFYLGFFWSAWDRQKQGWHDKIADTYVVKVEPRR